MPRTRRPDQRYRLAFVDVEGEVVDDGVGGVVPFGGIREGDVVEVDVALYVLQFLRVGVFRFDRLVDDLLHPLKAGHAVLQLLEDVDQLLNRV